MSDEAAAAGDGPPERGVSPPPQGPSESQGRKGVGLKTLIPVAVILVAALVQLFANLPSGKETASPYSASTCEFLFFGPSHGEFRFACERGQQLPK